MRRQAIIMRGFYTDPQVIERLVRLERDVSKEYDFYFLYDEKPCKVNLKDVPSNISTASFNQDNWTQYKVPDPYNKTFIPGNEETMFLMFQEQYPDYDYYWFIEYDVDYSGNWLEFFDCFSSNTVDLLTTTLVTYSEFPEWGMWKSLTPPPGHQFDDEDKLRGFFPVCRFSNRSLLYLKKCLSDGWSGHPEALIATLYRANKFTIEDIGGEGSCVRPDNMNKHYTNDRFNEDLSPGSFVFRPKFNSVGQKKNMLWHPVKNDSIKVWDSSKNPVIEFFSRILSRIKKLTISRNRENEQC